jgi:hypothetical protein
MDEFTPLEIAVIRRYLRAARSDVAEEEDFFLRNRGDWPRATTTLGTARGRMQKKGTLNKTDFISDKAQYWKDASADGIIRSAIQNLPSRLSLGPQLAVLKSL